MSGGFQRVVTAAFNQRTTNKGEIGNAIEQH
ncbi:Uncharacterised protein [Acinetobacter baumannii]|nr:Uncharacterised protein [Acinetobacter baumannii]